MSFDDTIEELQASERQDDDAAPSLEQLLRLVERDLAAARERFPDPLWHAALQFQTNELIEKAQEFIAFSKDVSEGKIRLSKPEHVRQTTFPMFCRLAERSKDKRVHEGAGRYATTYRSVSVCTMNDYFNRPVVSVLARQFKEALLDVFGEAGRDREKTLSVDRIVIVPDRRWPFSNQRRDSLKKWWHPLYAALLEQSEENETATGIASYATVTLRFARFSDVLNRQLDPATLDFGLYGVIMAGVYTRMGESEQLTLFHRESSQMRGCEAAWRELHDGGLDLKSWTEVANQLDIDVS